MPREKLVKYGASSLEEFELLAIILGSGTKNDDVFTISKNIIASIESIKNLKDYSYLELTKIKGIKLAKATKLIASIELAKRIFEYVPKKIRLKNPKSIYDLIKLDFIGKEQEELMIIFVDRKSILISKKIMAIGTNEMINVDLRAIVKEAIKINAFGLILVHNHPSDNLFPSESDLKTTKLLNKMLKIFNITLLDHLIISENNYYSFLEHHNLKLEA